MAVEFDGEESEAVESGRSRRQSPIEMELRKVLGSRSGSSLGDDELRNASFDIFDETELTTFRPKLGVFGAPQCRCTTSVIALLAITSGMVLASGGLCILVFFVEEEPTIFPLGVTLSTVGSLLFMIGSLMWTSEFMCDDCLGRAYGKLRDAPLKNAIERRSRMASRATNSRTNSRLSQNSALSLRTTQTDVSSNNKKF